MLRFPKVRLAYAFSAMLSLATPAFAQTAHRPIQDFLSAQTSQLFWFEPKTGNSVFVDYANRVNATNLLGLPTGLKGDVTERELADGRAAIRVILHTSDAYTTASQGGVGFVFGSTVAEIIGGEEPGLADSVLTVDFVNTFPGAPLPNLVTLFFAPAPGQEMKKVSFVATAFGPLRALFGVPAGTPGSVHTTQRGLFSVPGQGKGIADGFPAERVVIKEVGPGHGQP